MTPIGFILGILDYLRYPLLAIALIGLSTYRYKTLLNLFFVFTGVQIPFMWIQYLMRGGAEDSNAGTLGFGGQNYLGIILCYWLYYMLADQEASKFKKGMAMLAVIGAGLAGDVAFLYIAPFIVLLTSLYLKGSFNLKELARYLFGSLVILYLTLQVVEYEGSRVGGGVELLLDSSTVIHQLVNINTRSGLTWTAFDLMWSEPHSILNGLGVNAFYKGSVGKLSGNIRPIPTFYGKPLVIRWGNVELAYIGRALGLGAIQPVRVLAETGLLGLAAHVFLLATIWSMHKQYAHLVRSAEDERLHLTFKGMFFFYAFLGTLYCDTWRLDIIALPIWIYVSMMMTALKQTQVRRLRDFQSGPEDGKIGLLIPRHFSHVSFGIRAESVQRSN